MTLKNKKHYNKAIKLIVFIIVLILIFFRISIKSRIEIIKYEKIQLIFNNENITDRLKNELIIQSNNQVYMSLEDIKENIDKTIYVEEETGTIITTANKKVATMNENNKTSITINGSNKSIDNPVIKINEKTYIAISEMENVYNYECNNISEKNIVTLDSLDKKLVKADIKKTSFLKKENKNNSKSIEKLKKGTSLILIEEEKNLSKVRTQNGNIGYIKTNNLENIVKLRDENKEEKNNNIENYEFEYDLTNKDITTFKKREEIINSILQEMIKNDKINVKIKNEKENDFNLERFKIESVPILEECGIKVYF